MDNANSVSQYTALDGALLGAFFISYSVLALTQLNNLFNGRFILFFAVIACAALSAAGFELSDFSDFCANGPSAIVCGGTGRGLTILAMVWVYVSGAMFALFGVSRFIKTHRS